MARSGSRAGSPRAIVRRRAEQPFDPHAGPGRGRREGAGRPSRRARSIRPPASSRPCASPSTTSWASCEAGLDAAERVAEAGRAAGGGHLPFAGRPHREGLPDRARPATRPAARATRRRSPSRPASPASPCCSRARARPARPRLAANPRARSAKLRAARPHRRAGLEGGRMSPVARLFDWRSAASAASRSSASGLLVAADPVGVYLAKAAAGRERAEIASIERQITAEQRRASACCRPRSPTWSSPAASSACRAAYLGLEPVTPRARRPPSQRSTPARAGAAEGPAAAAPQPGAARPPPPPPTPR